MAESLRVDPLWPESLPNLANLLLLGKLAHSVGVNAIRGSELPSIQVDRAEVVSRD